MVRDSMISIGAARAPCAQQQRQVLRLLGGGHAGDLEAVAELLLDHGPGEHDRLGLLHQHHRHALLHVLARGLAHDAPAGVVERHRHDGAAAALGRLEARLRILDAVARDHQRLLHQHRAALLVEELVGAERRRLVLVLEERVLAGAGRVLLGDQPHLERRGAAEDFLGARRILHAGELHDDAVETLLLPRSARPRPARSRGCAASGCSARAPAPARASAPRA
jgi:hypothetical protein